MDGATLPLVDDADRFRRAVLDAPVPIMIHAEDGEVLQVNKRWSDLTGYTPGDLPTYAAWVEQACLLKPSDEPVGARDRMPGRHKPTMAR